MQTTEELSKEIAEFCRESVIRQPKCRVPQPGIGKTVLQGVMVALLAVTCPSDPGGASARSGPWQIGT